MTQRINLPEGYSLVSPYIIVKDVDKAVDFYQRAFSFTKKELVPGEDGVTFHAEMHYQGQV